MIAVFQQMSKGPTGEEVLRGFSGWQWEMIAAYPLPTAIATYIVARLICVGTRRVIVLADADQKAKGFAPSDDGESGGGAA